ncbi:MAG TPA: hypothetical protein VMM55_05885, partial [Thermohalobaculum sp.]|nr:hypothetical protein [Thermohalobaculum sp.]
MTDTTPPRDREAGSGTERLRRTAEEARDAAGKMWDEARDGAWETASGVADEARRRAGSEAERGKHAGASQAHQWASALDRAAEELGRDSVQGQFLHQASEGLDDLARSIEGRSVGEMAEAVADFGRRHPLAFVGSAMVAGFALARFATASRDDEPRPDHGPAPGRPADAGGPAADSELRLT